MYHDRLWFDIAATLSVWLKLHLVALFVEGVRFSGSVFALNVAQLLRMSGIQSSGCPMGMLILWICVRAVHDVAEIVTAVRRWDLYGSLESIKRCVDRPRSSP